MSDRDQVIDAASGVAQIAGFWRRLFAFCLDGLLLGVIGFCVGLFAYDDLVALGDWGRAVGFAVALTYFGATDSVLLGGQTLGKRMVGIKVTTTAGLPLSIGLSTIRAGIFCVPYFLNGSFIDFTTTWWLSALMFFLVFGVGISIAYLLLFNRHTRQSLHDLTVDAYVVSIKSRGPVKGGRIWPVHFGIVGLILIVSIVAPHFAQRLAQSGPFANLLSIQQGLQQVPNVRHATANISVGKFFDSRGTSTTHMIESRIFLSKRVTDFDTLANHLAQIILDRDPSAEKEDVIAISIVYGYDIGIASAWRGHNFSFSPSQWRKRFDSI